MALPLDDVYIVVLRATAFLISFAVGRFFYNGYVMRKRFRALKKQGIPIMPHSLIWGHLGVLGKHAQKRPKDNSTNHVPIFMIENWQTLFPGEPRCPTVAYLDLWPMSDPVIFSLHHNISAQFTQIRNLPKDPMEQNFMKPLTGSRDMVASNGEQWKRWRSVFNPGFSSRNIMALVPTIMEDMVRFLNVLEGFAGVDGQPGKVVQLEKLTTNLTFDIIGKATLGLQLDEQSGKSSALKEAMTYMASRMGTRPNLKRTLAILNPWSRMKKDVRTMDAVLVPHITRHLGSSDSIKDVKTIMDLALLSVEKEKRNGNDLEKDPNFVDSILQNMKAFLFAGHDTTATTICWVFKLLEENPECLATLRREQDEKLGPNPDDAADVILKSPHILNSMPYTLACIKETLRLYTPASTARSGSPDFFLVDPVTDMQYPTEGFVVCDGSPACHYRPDVWPRPREFIPDRWLVKEGDPLFPMKDSWRPFQQGPRNCIGQELALLELKLVICLVVRKLDINQAWDAWDELRGQDKVKETVDGERMYMTRDGTGHTKDEAPMRITRRAVSVGA